MIMMMVMVYTSAAYPLDEEYVDNDEDDDNGDNDDIL